MKKVPSTPVRVLDNIYNFRVLCSVYPQCYGFVLDLPLYLVYFVSYPGLIALQVKIRLSSVFTLSCLLFHAHVLFHVLFRFFLSSIDILKVVDLL